MVTTDTMTELKHVIAYTDGACIGNPGPGGFGVVLLFEGRRKEISGGFEKTTNNRMELTAVIKALESLNQSCRVTLYSDSEYVVKAMTLGWAEKWKANSWKRGKNGKAQNPDLWTTLLNLCQKHVVDFRWVKGHNAVTENERCDQLSTLAASKANLPPDIGYNG
jgi:ribonuclease HI